VEDPAHIQTLLELKRKALGSTAGGRLAVLVPESQPFLQAAFQQGESAVRLTSQLLGLLDDYGPSELAAALREALDRHTLHASSVAFILARRHRQQKRRAALPVDLSRRYERNSILLTTNRAFKDWNAVFPNATSIATLLDRLTHHADVTLLEGQSYRVRDSEQEAAARRKKPERNRDANRS